MTQQLQLDWIKSEATNLENCCNDNPLRLLGPHLVENDWVIRVWMPEAEEVSIVFKNKILTTKTPNHKWLFEVIVDENPLTNYVVNVLR